MASHYNILLLSAFLSNLCLNAGGFTVDLFHRESPLSPSFNPSETRFDRLKRAIDRSFSRRSFFMAKTSPNSEIVSTIIPGGGEYLMKVPIGTPPVEQLSIADTGSDLFWAQCKPCTECYNQSSPIFDPRRSKSYRTVSCDSDQCSTSGSSPSCGRNNVCQYQVSYGDNSYSIGDLATETLTFNRFDIYPKVVFGCGHENVGTFGQVGIGSGIIGLGGGSVSIINQLRKPIGGRFSYCLTTFDSNATSKIRFGSYAFDFERNFSRTPLVKKDPDTFYYLTLLGFSVGSKRVEYKSGVKQEVEEGNIIIDSGTTLTLLPPDLYEALESELSNAIIGTPVQGDDTFRLCYSAGSRFSAPPITAHFKGADVVLQPANTFAEVREGVVCLVLVPSDSLAIFGNLNQVNYRIGYELIGGFVYFQPYDCTKAQ